VHLIEQYITLIPSAKGEKANGAILF